jgi:S1-C subfamily serine protease/thioredoxin-like negative regulator of GroEL
MKHLAIITKLWILITVAICSQAFAADSEAINALRRARVLIEASRFKDAVAILKTYESQGRSDDLDISLLTGKIYLALDRPATALEYFERAYAQDLENYEAVMGAATANLKLGNFKQSRFYVDIASQVAKDSSEPNLVLSLITLRTGKVQEANAAMLTLSRQRSDSSDVAVTYARFLSSSGDNINAAKSLQTFIQKNPLSAEARDYLADLEFLFGTKANAYPLKEAAAQLYDRQGNGFKRDVVSAWLEVNRAKPDNPPPPAQPVSPKEEAAKKERVEPPPEKVAPKPPEQLAAKPELKPAKPQDKDLKPRLLPQTSDKEFAAAPLLRFPFPDGVMITGGSGFIVDSGRKIVTNRHVVEGGKEFAIRTGLGEVIKAKVIFISKTDDLAVLELDKALPADRAISSNAYSKPRVGRNVVVMGYPLWYVLGEGSPSLTNGLVSKRTGMGDDLGTFQLTAKVNKGNSGGPVFDMAGNVVGITVGKLDSKKIQDEQGFMPEDVNFAIHIDRLPKITNASVDGKEPNTVELNTEELYQVMLGKVVMVATYK